MIARAYINNMACIHPNGLEAEQAYLKACEPDYKEYIQNPTLRRRMSRIVKMGVACGLECIGNTLKEDIHAIITATGLGCLMDTEKFMNNVSNNKEQLLNPTPFIQSTFNTVGAQIALICQNQAYNVTYVHRGFSFESALLDGLLRLTEGDQNVLVGAFDEITPTSYTIQQRMGLLRKAQAGEGAQFFLLSHNKNEHTLAQISTAAVVPRRDYQVSMRVTRQDKQINEEIEDYLKTNGISAQDIDLLVCGKDRYEELLPHAEHTTFKDRCGEYQTAMAFAVWDTVGKLQENRDIRHALIYNEYYNTGHSFILISQP